LPAEVSATIEFYHHAWGDQLEREMSCIVYLEDALCRLRGLGNGCCEARELDWAAAAGPGATYVRVFSTGHGTYCTRAWRRITHSSSSTDTN
jgi:hypothetical protein